MDQSVLGKRELVNAEDHSKAIPESRRNQYTPDADLKARVVTGLLHATAQVCVLFGLKEEDLFNLTWTCQISSIVHTAHNVMKQQANPNSGGKMADKVTEGYTLKKGGDVITKTSLEVHALITEVFTLYGLRYTQ